MKISSYILALAILITFTINKTDSWAANPYSKYLKKVEVDKFNPGPKGKTLIPKQGGEITIRTPTDPQSLNIYNMRGAQAGEILTLMASSFVDKHLETFEILPMMAWRYEIRDLVTLKDETKIEGIIVEQNDSVVKIIENAGRVTIGKQDFESYDVKNGMAKSIDGTEYKGDLSERDYTVTIVPTKKTHSVREIPVSEIGSWVNNIGGKEEERLAANKHVIFYFELREKLFWNDGAEVKIDDFILALDTINNPNVDCARLRGYYTDIQSQERIDDRTIKYTYRKPYFQSLEIIGGILPLPGHIFQPEKYVGDEEGFAELFNTHKMFLPSDEPGGASLVMCGPYKMTHWLKGKEVVIERNPHYWTKHYDIPYAPKEMPYLDKITWTVINNKTAALKELQKGTVDVDFDIEPETWMREDTKTKEFTEVMVRAKSITPSFTYAGWNMNRDLFKSKEVRQALTMLIPREQILQDIHFGLGRVVSGPFFIDGPAYDRSIKPLPHDPRAAKRLLRKAGWIDRDNDGILDKDGVNLEFEYLVHTGRDYHAKIADIVKENVEQAKIKVTIRKLDWTVFIESVTDKNFDAVRLAWGAGIDPDPYQIWHSSQASDRGSNYVGYKNPEVDELIERLREEFDSLKRWEMVQKIHAILHEDQPYTFYFCFDSLQFYNKRFRNVKFYSTYQYGHNLAEWCVNYEWK